ncbi:RIC1 domain-containing protein [Ditylenchus destructor]|nr:RIC1 domain-containing protein [Ditylenchus destructor]
MYLPDNCDTNFTLPDGESEKVQWVAASRERAFVAIVTDSAIYFYLASLQLLLCSFKRNREEVEERGAYRKLYWRHTSNSVCVVTSTNFVYIYTVDISYDSECFILRDTTEDSPFGRRSEEFYLKQKRPSMNVLLAVVAKLESEPTCVVSLKDELFLCLKDGWIHRLSWLGDVLQEQSFNIRNVPFAVDQIAGKSEKFPNSSIHVVDLVYCPLVGGLCTVLSDGRAALLVSSTPQFNPESVSAVWALAMNDACCCSANHKFRLIYFGCKNGDFAGYTLDDTNGSLIQLFRLRLFVKNGTEYLDKLLDVRQIQCLSQGVSEPGSVVAVIWNVKRTNRRASSMNGSASAEEPVFDLSGMSLNGSDQLKDEEDEVQRCPPALGIFSPFGAQWWSSFESSVQSVPHALYTSMDWGPEGFQLWLGSSRNGVVLMNFIRSVPEFLERVIMVGSDRICISPMKSHEKHATAPHCIWATYKVPHDYISANWPIRHLAINSECNRVLVVAGNRGFCFCTLKNMKWKIFQKEAQERALLITGGVSVFQDFILVSACNVDNESEAIYAFNIADQLDLDTAIVLQTNRILLMSSRQDHLLTFDVSSTITIYSLLHSAVSNGANKAKDSEDNNFQLHPPTLIASNVERVWIHQTSRQIPHLNKALWINAGCRKMKIWLPLSQQLSATSSNEENSTNSKRSFISRRIMLPIELGLYPLAIDEDCLACGAESSSSFFQSEDADTNRVPPISVHSLSRQTEVFLHRLLKQLLKRNLGNYALAIASACRSLPYFSHILELLLHDVLDEEATSSEPIPDPFLPTVVSFIREFPEYLQTIVHCARKTELAFWNLLFSVSHHPKEIFKMCMEEDQLDTATSCLILLQSMEPASASTQYASILLEEALNKRRWTLARDIVRFMQSIGRTDYENTPESPLYMKLIARGNKPMHILPADATSDPYGLAFNGNSSDAHHTPASSSSRSAAKTSIVTRQPSITGTGHSPSNVLSISTPTQSNINPAASFIAAQNQGSVHKSTSPQQQAGPLKMPSLDGPSQSGLSILRQLDDILVNHAVALLEYYALRDLGAFAAHLDFDLMSFFLEPKHAFSVLADDFPLVLMKLHAQFSWPYPIPLKREDFTLERSNTSLSSISNGSTLAPVFNINGVVPAMSSEKDDMSSTCSTYSFAIDNGYDMNLSWKVFEKLWKKIRQKGTEQSEAELNHMMDLLAKADALEWIYLLCIMRQDVKMFNAKLLNELHNQKRLEKFLDNIREGTTKLYLWAESRCPAYKPILSVFKEFADH